MGDGAAEASVPLPRVEPQPPHPNGFVRPSGMMAGSSLV
jgi:hypothetical protein